MSKKISRVFSCLLVLAISSSLLRAEQQNGREPDSAQVQMHIEASRKAAGTEWIEAWKFFCDPDQKTANKADDPIIEPVKLFDNLYAIGRSTTIIYALDTPDGLILLDAGYANDVEPVLIPGLTKLKLDPKRIKYVVISHGHADHFGGAKYLQEQYGARIYVTAADWDAIERAPAAGAGPGVMPPKRDLSILENQPIVLGQTKLTSVFLPGHTPGTVALIFSVKDRGKAHTVGYLGAPMLIPPPDPQVQQHIQSLRRFGEIARKMKVDVELLNHPMMDGMAAKITKLQGRASGGPNPFVVGVESYQRFLTVSSECLESVLARRADKRAR